MADVLRGLGAEVELEGDTARYHDAGGAQSSRPFRRRQAVPCVGLRTGPADGARSTGRWSHFRVVTRSVPVRWTCTSRACGRSDAHRSIEHGCVVAPGRWLVGAEITLEFPSVGATENILMAAVLAKGLTVIQQRRARAGDRRSLRDARADGGRHRSGSAPTRSWSDGVEKLHPTEHRVIGDRIVAATWGFAAVDDAGRHHRTTGWTPEDARGRSCQKLQDAGATVTERAGRLPRIALAGRPHAVNVDDPPVPRLPHRPAADGDRDGLRWPTGTSMITENVFEARFRFVEEMVRLGADARTDGHHAVDQGSESSSRAHPSGRRTSGRAWDWSWPGLCADGVTEVHDVFHIDRGYPNFVGNVKSLGGEDRAGALSDRRYARTNITGIRGFHRPCDQPICVMQVRRV